MNKITAKPVIKKEICYEEKMCVKCKGKGTLISSTGYEVECDCQKGEK